MQFPEHLLYTRDHEWIKIDGDNAVVGVTDFAQRELGDIVFIEVGAMGKALNKHEVFGSIEAVKTVADMYMPLAGTVVELNANLESKPELVNNDPYNEGWIVKIKLSQPIDTSDLLDTKSYQKTLNL